MSFNQEVPPGWIVSPTSELLSFVTSGSRGWAQYYSDKGSPFIRIGDLQRGTLSVAWQTAQCVSPPTTTEGSRTRVRPGDILISITADLGVIGVIPDGAPEAYVNQHVALARPTSAVLPRFLGWFLDAEAGGQRQLRDLRRGATKAGLGLDDIRSIEVPLPTLAQQGAIVAAIETHFSRLHAAVASLTRAKVNVKRARASVLKAAVEGRLVPTEAALARAEGRAYEPASVLLDRILAERKAAWAASGARGKYQEPVKPDTEGLPEMPEGWCWASIQQLSEAKREPTYGVVKLGEVTEGGIPVLRSSNVRALALDLAYVKPISPEIERQYARTRLEGGEVLVTVRGTLGGVVVAPAGCLGWNVSREVAVVALQQPEIGPFAAISFKSPTVEAWISQRLKGIAYTGLNIETLKQVPIPLPPLAEQHRIVAEVDRRLSVLDTLDATLDANLARCARLRQAVLKRAFEGRLVPAEVDLPAHHLLCSADAAP